MTTLRRTASVFLLFSIVTLVPGGERAEAAEDKPTVIRFASLVPASSVYMRILKAWSRSLKKESEGRLELRYYTGGSQGDERDFIRKIRVGQMDAAAVSTVGLGIVVRPVLVLGVPGLIETYEQLGRVRKAMYTRFEKMFDEAGFTLLAWSDAGKTRVFSNNAFARPSDLKALRPWAWKDDPVFDGFLKAIGANPVRLGVPEVYPALQTGMVDTVPCSALAALALQWYTKLKYIAKQNFGVLVGAVIIKKKKFEALSPEDQAILRDTAKRAAQALDNRVRDDDDNAYQTLTTRGLVEVDTAPHAAEWGAAAKKTRESLVGRVYSRSLLQEVEAAVAGQ